ncbi:mannosyltransferase [Scheffersomyces xylosifermentans]|uniref:mannosyltransferase n=1 Tax=Scheffersomyces xylosifermentans TaxID=1304137 RepID=UPI00315D2568
MFSLNIYHVLLLSVALRIGFFIFGLYQDKYMTVKYTDIDYLVFSDAASYVQYGQSPYQRETYRYTPLLAWMLVPNGWGENWYSFGKALFMASDLVTGYIIVKLLSGSNKLSSNKVVVLSSIWLLNPMVITISTRGSSESVLTVMIMASIYYLVQKKNIVFSAFWLGLAVHFKLYPIIYLPSIMLYLARDGIPFINLPILKLVTTRNISFLFVTVFTIAGLNFVMYQIYGYEFIHHSYIYHFIRLDHRHNFSVYNIALYYKSAISEQVQNIENFAFIPQFLISAVAMPLAFAQRDLISCFFLQTLSFVTFNKVMTSQYFIWFLIFLPHFLSKSNLVTKNHAVRGVFTLLLWIASQATWLYFAYHLEFLGVNTFDNGLLYSSIFFFLSNCWIIGQFTISLQ